MNQKVKVLKALADENRLNIVDILSCGELCVCSIIEGLNLTQPTVSHHLKILRNAGLVTVRKEGKWHFFSLEESSFSDLSTYIKVVSSNKEKCICNTVQKKCDSQNKI